MAAGSPDAVSDPTRLQLLNCAFRLPSATNKMTAHITCAHVYRMTECRGKEQSRLYNYYHTFNNSIARTNEVTMTPCLQQYKQQNGLSTSR